MLFVPLLVHVSVNAMLFRSRVYMIATCNYLLSAGGNYGLGDCCHFHGVHVLTVAILRVVELDMYDQSRICRTSGVRACDNNLHWELSGMLLLSPM